MVRFLPRSPGRLAPSHTPREETVPLAPVCSASISTRLRKGAVTVPKNVRPAATQAGSRVRSGLFLGKALAAATFSSRSARGRP